MAEKLSPLTGIQDYPMLRRYDLSIKATSEAYFINYTSGMLLNATRNDFDVIARMASVDIGSFKLDNYKGTLLEYLFKSLYQVCLMRNSPELCMKLLKSNSKRELANVVVWRVNKWLTTLLYDSIVDKDYSLLVESVNRGLMISYSNSTNMFEAEDIYAILTKVDDRVKLSATLRVMQQLEQYGANEIQGLMKLQQLAWLKGGRNMPNFPFLVAFFINLNLGLEFISSSMDQYTSLNLDAIFMLVLLQGQSSNLSITETYMLSMLDYMHKSPNIISLLGLYAIVMKLDKQSEFMNQFKIAATSVQQKELFDYVNRYADYSMQNKLIILSHIVKLQGGENYKYVAMLFFFLNELKDVPDGDITTLLDSNKAQEWWTDRTLDYNSFIYICYNRFSHLNTNKFMSDIAMSRILMISPAVSPRVALCYRILNGIVPYLKHNLVDPNNVNLQAIQSSEESIWFLE